MSKKRRTIAELIEKQAGAWTKRNEIILALCQGGINLFNSDPDACGLWAIRVANKIVEEIYNG